MKIRTLLAALVVAVAGLALLPASSPASYWRHCGANISTGSGWFAARGHNISCPKTRAVAQKYTFGQDSTPYRFNCNQRQIGDEVWAVACRRNEPRVQKVRFKFGA